MSIVSRLSRQAQLWKVAHRIILRQHENERPFRLERRNIRIENEEREKDRREAYEDREKLLEKAKHFCFWDAARPLKKSSNVLFRTLALAVNEMFKRDFMPTFLKLEAIREQNTKKHDAVFRIMQASMRRQDAIEKRRVERIIRFDRVRRVWFLLHNDQKSMDLSMWDQLVDEFFAMTRSEFNFTNEADEECNFMRNEFAAERVSKGFSNNICGKFRTDGIVFLGVMPSDDYRRRFALAYYRLAKRLRRQKRFFADEMNVSDVMSNVGFRLSIKN